MRLVARAAAVISDAVRTQARPVASVTSNLGLLGGGDQKGKSAPFARRTHIVATVGPRGDDPEHMCALLAAGARVIRFNMSHSSPPDILPRLSALQAALRLVGEKEETPEVPPSPLSGSRLGAPRAAVAIDLKGPEVRTGVVPEPGITLVQDQRVVLHTKPLNDPLPEGAPLHILVDYPALGSTLQKKGGGPACVYIDDGLIQLGVEAIEGDTVRCVVLAGGLLGSRKGVNLPGCQVDLPAVSLKDKEDLKFAAENNCDLVFASFVRTGEQVREIRSVLAEHNGESVGVISKIENQEGLDNLDDILRESDGVMVARGDLGIEIPPEEVVRAQKCLIAKSMVSAKPVICATQMLESMVDRPRPTRAEISDVGNAVIDGADCVMLSAETAKGKYFQESVETMVRASTLAESIVDHGALSEQLRRHIKEQKVHPEWTLAWAEATVSASFSYDSPLIVCLALTARTARLIASMRPRARIIMPCPSQALCAVAGLHSGLEAIHCPELGFDARRSKNGGLIERHVVTRVIEYARLRGYCSAGDVVVACHNEYDNNGDASSVLRFIRVDHASTTPQQTLSTLPS